MLPIPFYGSSKDKNYHKNEIHLKALFWSHCIGSLHTDNFLLHVIHGRGFIHLYLTPWNFVYILYEFNFYLAEFNECYYKVSADLCYCYVTVYLVQWAHVKCHGFRPFCIILGKEYNKDLSSSYIYNDRTSFPWSQLIKTSKRPEKKRESVGCNVRKKYWSI